MDSQRGKIINRDAAKQIRDFSLLCYGTITPTDIDGFIDINNRIFIFLELKYKNKELPYGQRLAYERLIDTCQIAKKISIGIIASHENDYHCDINVGNAIVIEFRFNNEWHQLNKTITCKRFIDKTLKFFRNILPERIFL